MEFSQQTTPLTEGEEIIGRESERRERGIY